MRKPKPKPCPFCQSPTVFVERYSYCVFGVVCDGCFVVGPKVEHAKYDDGDKGHGLGERDAIRLWNGRSQKAHTDVLASCQMKAAV